MPGLTVLQRYVATVRTQLLCVSTLAVLCWCRSLVAGPAATVLSVNESTTNFPQVLNYSVETDPDQPFNSGALSRTNTVFNAALQKNPNARVDQGRVMVLIEPEQRGSAASQGGTFLEQYTFAHWQYIDRFVDWGGTSEGNIKIPRSGWIDAAHRNGVKIYGNIFLAPITFGGRVEHVEYLTQTDDRGSYPVADRLITIAETQGFDGYFLNQEVNGVGAANAEEVGRFMDYIQANSDIEVIWYDAQTEAGSVGWQDELNSQNDRFFQNSGQTVSQAMFLDFGASVGELSSSRSVANSLGRSEFDLYAGANLEGGGIAAGAGQLLNSFSAPGGNHRSSLGLFRPDNAAWFAATSGADFDIQAMIDEDTRTYVGANGDPSDTANAVSGTEWRGIAHYVAAKSPLVNSTFMTNFNYGLGTKYAVEGQVSSTDEWNNIGLQDVLPTWRWVVSTDDPSPLVAEFDFDNPYHGGNSVRFSGSLDEETTVPLYLASIPVRSDAQLSLTYTTGEVGDTSAEVELVFLGREASPVYLPLGASSSSGWNTTMLDLSGFVGERIASIGMRFLDNDQQDYQFNLGRLGVVRGAIDVPDPPTNTSAQFIEFAEPGVAGVRLQWDHSADYSRDAFNGVYNYNVFRQGEDGRVFLGGTSTNAFFVDALTRSDEELVTVLEVQTVGTEFGVSTPDVFKVRWETTAVLVLDRGTGQASLVNPLGDTISLETYSIHSRLGSLNPSGWESLGSQGVPGWQETNARSRLLSEVSSDGALVFPSDGAYDLGSAYDPVQLEFGIDDEDVVFEYAVGGSTVQGRVVFVGESRNNLVLVVDPSTGRVRMENQSVFAVDIEGYRVASQSGSLLIDDGQWNSLDDQGAAGGDWAEANPTANMAAELKPATSTTITEGLAFDLGSLFEPVSNGGVRDLSFQYLLSGESEFRQGVVIYLETLPGDFNADGKVDSADYTVWRDNLGMADERAIAFAGNGNNGVDIGDYIIWKAHFGRDLRDRQAADPIAAPEPASIAMLLLASLPIVSVHRRVM